MVYLKTIIDSSYIKVMKELMVFQILPLSNYSTLPDHSVHQRDPGSF